MNENFVHIHLHTSVSSSVMQSDSLINPTAYIEKAKEMGMKGFIFTEHGNALIWYKKKQLMEKEGFKYIHAVEGYVCNDIEDKNNYHILVYALNYDGVREINRLISLGYKRDGHFYYRPRFTIDELLSCNNIIISTACLAGVFNTAAETELGERLLQWGINHKDRFFLEIQPHNVDDQKKYNFKLIELAKKYGLNLIASNDVHYIDDKSRTVRSLIQEGNGIAFSQEDEFDLSFKSYNDMLLGFIQQGIDSSIAEEALNNTSKLYDMPEEFTMDRTFKFPQLYNNPTQVMVDRCINSLKELKLNTNNVYQDRLIMELKTFYKLNAQSYMLLFSDWAKGCAEQGIYWGFSRGSSSGSLVAYLLGITEIDPIIWHTSFSRFMNEERVTLPDIDVDIEPQGREIAKQWFYDHPKLNACEILALVTEQEKGAIDTGCRALGISLADGKVIKDNITESRKKPEYQQLFDIVDDINGYIKTISSHPAGVLVTDKSIDISSEIGIITIKEKNDDGSEKIREICQFNMKELEDLGYVKADALGLANVGVINKVYNMLGKTRPTPQEIDFNDESVWEEIKKSPVGIFQFESEESHRQLCLALDNAHGADKIQTTAMTSGIIRPSGESIRANYLQGIPYDNGHEAINELFKDNLGYIIYQEDIMMFLKEFCGYNDHEADTVRRGIAKKIGTEKLIPEIESRFIEYFSHKYDVSEERCQELIKGFLKIVEDASSYGFSYNHSISYSMLGYLCGYLRKYYPIYYYTAMLTEFKDKPDKMKEIYRHIYKFSDYTVQSPTINYAKMNFSCDAEHGIIYEGLFGLKGLSKNSEEGLNMLPKDINSYLDILVYIKENQVPLSKKDLTILIQKDMFRQFGGQKYLLGINELFFDVYKYNPKTKQNTKDKKIASIKSDMEKLNPDDDYSYAEKMINELRISGQTNKKIENLVNNVYFVLSLNHPYPSKYVFKGYNLRTGEVETYQLSRDDYPVGLDKNDVVMIGTFYKKERKQMVNGKWVGTGEFAEWIKNVSKVVI